MPSDAELGAVYLGDGRTRFRVWAPCAETVQLYLPGSPERLAPMIRETGAVECETEPPNDDYFGVIAENVRPGARYYFRIDGEKDRPDPASRHQPEGVHGPSEVVDPSFAWTDDSWRGLPLKDYVIYEMHVGTFTPEGTFEAVIPRLEGLRELGVTAIELMPVAQFPGSRNWGYDGVALYAPQNSYGGPIGLRRLIDHAHRLGLAAILDVVYNHLGPEGNYLRDFAPYFTDRYKTPWGEAINLDGAGSDHVRRFLTGNALFWFEQYHFDALRLDALHAIHDMSARPWLAELAGAVDQWAKARDRCAYLIAESDLNDSRLIRGHDQGGLGLHAQWNDDFHHALHALLTGENGGYYKDFGALADLVKAWCDGYVYSGRHSAFRGRRHGNESADLPPERFVVFSQNHDQVGNRMLGERLWSLAGPAAARLAAGAVLLSPYIPLLFMGEEYGEPAPFLYFVDHGDPDLIDAVRKGRPAEFAAFSWPGGPPDPASPATMDRSRLRHGLKDHHPHRAMHRFYRELLDLRRAHPALGVTGERGSVNVSGRGGLISALRRGEGREILILFNFSKRETALGDQAGAGRWRRLLDSEDPAWGRGGLRAPDTLEEGQEATMPPRCFWVFERSES